MPKKLFVILLASCLLASCGLPKIEENNPPKSLEEIEFEQSGQAKAIENETDLWPVYENAEAGFSFKFPGNFELNRNLQVRVDRIEDLGEQPLNFTTATAKANQAALAAGQFGQGIDWPSQSSARVKNLGKVNAQDFLVLSRFEICDVALERKLLFYWNDFQIILTVLGDRDQIIAENPSFFATDPTNCGKEKIWNFEKQAQFFSDLEKGNGSPTAQAWFTNFDKIVETLEFFEPAEPSFEIGKLLGKWTSLDDSKSQIEFADNQKIDFYDQAELSRGNFAVSNEGLLTVQENDEILEYQIDQLDDSNLVLLFLPRGNLLKYRK